MHVNGKFVECKTRFPGDKVNEYCTKFGSSRLQKMTVDTRSKILNRKNISVVDDDAKHVRLEIVVIAD